MSEYLESYGVADPERGGDARLFLKAMGEALQRGEYHLRPRFASTFEGGSGECIGLYSDGEIVLRCSVAAEVLGGR